MRSLSINQPDKGADQHTKQHTSKQTNEQTKQQTNKQTHQQTNEQTSKQTSQQSHIGCGDLALQPRDPLLRRRENLDLGPLALVEPAVARSDPSFRLVLTFRSERPLCCA
jgi:hypothetical protein